MKDKNLKSFEEHYDYKKSAADYCKYCGKDIYIGEKYYDFNGITICKECINDYRRTARSKE